MEITIGEQTLTVRGVSREWLAVDCPYCGKTLTAASNGMLAHNVREHMHKCKTTNLNTTGI